MSHIAITKVENGWIVDESDPFQPIRGRRYVFQTADALCAGLKALLEEQKKPATENVTYA
jgi:hypothetical protein